MLSNGGGDIATNNAIGTGALNSNTTGASNVAVGYQALPTNTTASNNTAVGYQSGYSNTTGVITAIGAYALYANTTGIGNTAVGGFDGTNSSALRFNTTGINNTAVGTAALAGNVTNSYSTAVGYQAIKQATGDSNTSVGCFSGEATTTGSQNTYVGQYAGYNNVSGSNNTCIGRDASLSSGTANNQIVLGVSVTSAGDNYFTFGKASNAVFNQFTSNASWTRISDGRLKTNVANDNLGLEFINKLRPVTHKWKPSNEIPQELTRHYNEENQMDTDVVLNGFIAQEVKQALDECGSPVFGGWMEMDDGSQAISREMFIFPLINAIQELNAKVDAQALEIAALKATP